ncbi:MAG: antitoxin [Actinobacteria bacterium]|nr:antitoxin [Actinomycetota bacterium]MBI4883843.1 antitoxin [Actinomycetota bacterium]
MSFLDKIKGLLGGNKSTAKDAIDKVADVIESKTPDSIDDKVEAVAAKAKKAVDKVKG